MHWLEIKRPAGSFENGARAEYKVYPLDIAPGISCCFGYMTQTTGYERGICNENNLASVEPKSLTRSFGWSNAPVVASGLFRDCFGRVVLGEVHGNWTLLT
jgi:hypothetical protein